MRETWDKKCWQSRQRGRLSLGGSILISRLAIWVIQLFCLI